MAISRDDYRYLMDRQDIKVKNYPAESVVQLQIIKYLKSIGAVVGKTKTMGVKRGNNYCFDYYTMRGKCDLEAFKNGIMYGIEVKSVKGRLDDNQKWYRDIFHKPPDRIFIEAHSLEDIIEKIK